MFFSFQGDLSSDNHHRSMCQRCQRQGAHCPYQIRVSCKKSKSPTLHNPATSVKIWIFMFCLCLVFLYIYIYIYTFWVVGQVGMFWAETGGGEYLWGFLANWSSHVGSAYCIASLVISAMQQNRSMDMQEYQHPSEEMHSYYIKKYYFLFVKVFHEKKFRGGQ